MNNDSEYCDFLETTPARAAEIWKLFLGLPLFVSGVSLGNVAVWVVRQQMGVIVHRLASPCTWHGGMKLSRLHRALEGRTPETCDSRMQDRELNNRPVETYSRGDAADVGN